MVAPPSEVTVPPEFAPLDEISVTSFVVNAGTLIVLMATSTFPSSDF